MTGLETPRF